MKVLSLFAGIGGFDLGLERAGMQTAAFCEIDPFARWPENDPASGANMLGSLARYDRATSSWKTSQLCLGGGLETFSETWPRSGMMRSGIAYRLPTLAPLTAATASGLWPTPRANDGEKRGEIANDIRSVLPAAAKHWPTPTSRDWRSGKASQATMDRNARPLSEVVGGTLNPTWVEWLMGFPLGWTDCGPSETPSSPKSRN